MGTNVEVIVGTYESFLLGYRANESEHDGVSFVHTFATKPHNSMIKCLATGGKYVASGSVDDKIVIYDMQKRKEIQTLINHDGTINTLAFTPFGRNILSGGSDGKFVINNCDSWQTSFSCDGPHSKRPITQITCHPSGKVAISLGLNKRLLVWNIPLMDKEYAVALKDLPLAKNEAEGLAYSPCGEYVSIITNNRVLFWSINRRDSYKVDLSDAKPTSVCWLPDSQAVVGLENGQLFWASIDTKETQEAVQIYDQRIKAMACVDYTLATACSSGEITLWNVNKDAKTLTKICETNTDCRPTCLALVDLNKLKDNFVLKTQPKACEDESLEIGKVIKQRKSFAGHVQVEFSQDLPKRKELKHKKQSPQQKKKAQVEVDNIFDDLSQMVNFPEKRNRKKKKANLDSQVVSGWTVTEKPINITNKTNGWKVTSLNYSESP